MPPTVSCRHRMPFACLGAQSLDGIQHLHTPSFADDWMVGRPHVNMCHGRLKTVQSYANLIREGSPDQLRKHRGIVNGQRRFIGPDRWSRRDRISPRHCMCRATPYAITWPLSTARYMCTGTVPPSVWARERGVIGYEKPKRRKGRSLNPATRRTRSIMTLLIAKR